MEIPVNVTFLDMNASEAVREACVQEAEKLEKFHDRITACRVVVAHPHSHSHSHKGALFSVRVDISVPGREVVVNKDHGEKHAHADCLAAVRDAFKIARRQLDDHTAKRRGDIKHHEAPPHGRVGSLEDGEDFGFITTDDGRELYFHKNSVLNADFDNLEIGSEVRYAEEEGEDGPQAASVKLLGRRA